MALILRAIAFLAEILLVVVIAIVLLAPQFVANVIPNIEAVPVTLRAIIVAVLVIGLIAGLLGQLRRKPKRGREDALTVNTAGTVTAVSVDSVRERILKSVSSVPGVANVNAKLASVGGNADVELNVDLASDDINVPEKQREINRVLEQVIKKQLGIQLAGKPKINIQLGRKPEPISSIGSLRSTPAFTPPPAPVVARNPEPITPAPVISREPERFTPVIETPRADDKPALDDLLNREADVFGTTTDDSLTVIDTPDEDTKRDL